MMKTISLQKLRPYRHHLALFFTPEGILVEEKTRSPFIPFSHAEGYFEVQHVFLDEGAFLIVQGQLRSLHPPLPFRSFPAKTFLTEADEHTQSKLLQAIHWVSWNQRVQYCQQCGGHLEKIPERSEKSCTVCNVSFFPNLSPAVIMLVQRDDEILLARSPHFKPGMYSALAGFVGLGETAEEAACREVFEEVGLRIQNLTYFGSQSWPFPSSFMIAFKAQCTSGTLRLDPDEIEDARWFKVHDLPLLPPPPSISHALIQSVMSDWDAHQNVGTKDIL